MPELSTLSPHHPIPVPMRKIHSTPDWTSTHIPIPLHSWLQNTFAVFNNLFILTFSSFCFWLLHSDIRHTKKADSFPYTPSKFVNVTDQPPSLGLWQLSTRKKKLAMYTLCTMELIVLYVQNLPWYKLQWGKPDIYFLLPLYVGIKTVQTRLEIGRKNLST